MDLKLSPAPAFDLLPGNGRNLIPIQTARGCPHGCRFCNLRGLYGKGYRSKSISHILNEIENISSVNPLAAIYFTDDNFFCRKERVLELLDAVKSAGKKWYANSDVSLGFDVELIQSAYRAGCRQVLIGFESINPKNLRNMDENNFKAGNSQNYGEIIDKIQSNGIGVIGSFILGLDEDDHDTFHRLAEFIYQTKLYGVSLTVSTPYPGTEFFSQMVEEDRLLTTDWDHYTIFQPIVKPLRMTRNELSENYIELINKINSRQFKLNKYEYFKNILRELKAGE